MLIKLHKSNKGLYMPKHYSGEIL